MKSLSGYELTLLGLFAATLLLGGASAAGFAGNLALQIAALAVLAFALATGRVGRVPNRGLALWFMALAGVLLLQFLPLPPMIWSALPGREGVASGFEMLGLKGMPWQQWSLAADRSLASMTWWLPPLALFLLMLDDRGPDSWRAAWVASAVAVASIALGALQRLGGGAGYLYRVTNDGFGVGFFANTNHQASFLLCVLALITGLYASAVSAPRRQRGIGPAFYWGAVALLVVGVLLSGSLAGMLLLIPVGLACALMLWRNIALNRWTVLAAALGALAIIAFMWLAPIENDLRDGAQAIAGISRRDFLDKGLIIARDFAPVGTGLGTFSLIYPWYEQFDQVTPTFVNHAHNDVLEVLIELGLPGAILMLAFAAIWARLSWAIWRARDNFGAMAGSIIVGTLLAHSFVDYPLRTAASASVFALGLAMMIRPQPVRGRSRREERGPVEKAPMIAI